MTQGENGASPEGKRPVDIDRLDEDLRKAPHMILSEGVVNRLLRNEPFEGWGLKIREDRGRSYRVLATSVYPPTELDPPLLEAPGGEVRVSNSAVEIEADRVTGNVFLCVTNIIRQMASKRAGVEEKPALSLEELNELAKKFALGRGEYLNENDQLDVRQTIALSLTTHYGSNNEIATALKTQRDTIDRTLKPIRESLGLDSRMEGMIDLMLAAIALKKASIDHIPIGKTDILEDEDKEFMSKYYNPSRDDREKASIATQNRWKNICENLFLNGRNRRIKAVLYGVMDDTIMLPDPEIIRNKLTRG